MGNIGIAVGVTAVGMTIAGVGAATFASGPPEEMLPKSLIGAAAAFGPAGLTGAIVGSAFLGTASTPATRFAFAPALAAAGLVFGAGLLGAQLSRDH